MSRIVEFLRSHVFRELFRELGWDRADTEHSLRADDRDLHFRAVAQKRGLAVFHCATDRVVLADQRTLRVTQKQLLKVFHEHVVIYTSDEPRKQVWQWAFRRDDGLTVRHREHPFFSESPPPPFVNRLERLRFSLDEEETASLVDARHRIHEALDADAELSLFAKRPKLARLSDQLARQLQSGDLVVFHRFVLLHRSLARKLSRRLHRWFGMDPDDAEQIAVLGLLTAARKFKPELGYQFSTYAHHWICQSCQRLGPSFALPIHVPLYVFWPCFRLQLQLTAMEERGIPPEARVEFVAQIERDETLAVNWKRLRRAIDVRELPGPNSLIDRNPTPPEQMNLAEAATEVHRAVGRLRGREPQVLRLRYGLGCRSQTLEEIGRLLGITKERVRQIQEKAIERLRSILERSAPPVSNGDPDRSAAETEDDFSGRSEPIPEEDDS